MMRSLASTATAVGWSKYWLEALTGIELADTRVSLPVGGSTSTTAPEAVVSHQSATSRWPSGRVVIWLGEWKYWLLALTAMPFADSSVSLPVVGLTSMMPPPVPNAIGSVTKMSPAASVVIPCA